MNSVVRLCALLFCTWLPVVIVSAQTPLVSPGDTWRYHKGTNAPSAGWQTIADSSLNLQWGSGAGGFGYGDGDDATLLNDMGQGSMRYTTVYVRRTFNISGPLDPILVLRLVVDYDDAYVAYLDGQEIARSANIRSEERR